MIGIYDYTVVLTYMSLVSAIGGITLAVARTPHRFSRASACCSAAFATCSTGIARKKNRTEEEKAFGIQIDSLATSFAFGVQPAVRPSRSAATAGMPIWSARCSCWLG